MSKMSKGPCLQAIVFVIVQLHWHLALFSRFTWPNLSAEVYITPRGLECRGSRGPAVPIIASFVFVANVLHLHKSSQIGKTCHRNLMKFANFHIQIISKFAKRPGLAQKLLQKFAMPCVQHFCSAITRPRRIKTYQYVARCSKQVQRAIDFIIFYLLISVAWVC